MIAEVKILDDIDAVDLADIYEPIDALLLEKDLMRAKRDSMVMSF